MKTIQEIPTWVKGQAVTATIFNLRPIGGELFQSASFYYALLDSDLAVTADGNLTMSGEAYNEWGNDDEYAYNYAAEKLNLIITGDYVAPIVEIDKTAEKLNSDFPLFDAIIESEIVKDSLTVEN
jgi:hypothetical protein